MQSADKRPINNMNMNNESIVIQPRQVCAPLIVSSCNHSVPMPHPGRYGIAPSRHIREMLGLLLEMRI